MPKITIDELIEALQKNNDARRHNWEDIRHYVRVKNYGQVLRKMRNMVDDDDFNDAFEIICRYVATNPGL